VNENVLGYLESVQSHGWEKDLIPRPYGWRVWLHYYWLLALHTLKAWSGHYFYGSARDTARKINLRADEYPIPLAE